MCKKFITQSSKSRENTDLMERLQLYVKLHEITDPNPEVFGWIRLRFLKNSDSIFRLGSIWLRKYWEREKEKIKDWFKF